MPLTISFSSNQTSIQTSGKIKIGKIAKAHDTNIYRHFSIFYFFKHRNTKGTLHIKGVGKHSLRRDQSPSENAGTRQNEQNCQKLMSKSKLFHFIIKGQVQIFVVVTRHGR
jgi:hypothetical protein